MAIKIISVGKKHDSWVSEGIERYESRLKKPYVIEWVLLPHSALQDAAARQEESERLLAKVAPQDFVILLDELGDEFDSPQLAKLLDNTFTAGRQVVLIIGGAYGVDGRVQERADVMWSLSLLVFPHQLVRLILTEQLYRAQQITAGHPYHHI